MFDTFGDLPLHPLAIHAAVVLVPLTTVLALLFAIPRTRTWARWPLAVVAVVTPVAVFVAVQSGESFEEALELGGPIAEIIDRHAELAQQLMIIVLVLAVAALAAAVLHRPQRDGAERRSQTVVHVLAVVVLVLSVVATVWAYRVGELGSEAVWNPTGDVEYGLASSASRS